MGKRKIVKAFKCIMMMAVCLAAAGGIVLLAVHIYEVVQNQESQRFGSGWGGKQEAFQDADTVLLFNEICGLLEEGLNDGQLHINSILQNPNEYEIWDIFERLTEVEKEDLTLEKQLLYEKLLYCQKMYQLKMQLPDYTPHLSELTGPVSTIPEIFYTCIIRTGEEAGEYLSLLGQVPELLESFLSELKQQQEIGVRYPEDVVERQLELCQRLAGNESIFLLDFEEKIAGLSDISEWEKERLIKQNRKIVENSIWPVLVEIEEQLAAMTMSEQSVGLCNYALGKQYFDYILELGTGSGMNAEEMYLYLEEKRKEYTVQVLNQEYQFQEEVPSSYEEILEILHQGMAGLYPDILEVCWEICEIPDYLNDRMYSGFFTRGLLENGYYIYVGGEMKGMSYGEIYQIMAHEGFPGHMYWYCYERKTEFSLLDRQMKCLGYSEGWATAAEYAVGDLLQGNREQYLSMLDQKLLDKIFLSQADIGIHTFGWDKEKLKSFMQEVYGRSEASVVEEVFHILVSNAGAYEPYVVGYFQLMELKQYCVELCGMEEQEFIRMYLEAGQTPFTILKEYAAGL